MELNKLKTWLDENKPSLNLSKTKLIFGNQKIDNEITLRINNTTFEKVYEFKFLGVLIDHKLSWKSHINHGRQKMSKNIAILYRGKEILNQKALYSLYCSLTIVHDLLCGGMGKHL